MLYVDLTDALSHSNFEDASGVLLRWENPSKNLLRFKSPEKAKDSVQPVWLVMKPWAGFGALGAED